MVTIARCAKWKNDSENDDIDQLIIHLKLEKRRIRQLLAILTRYFYGLARVDCSYGCHVLYPSAILSGFVFSVNTTNYLIGLFSPSM